MHFKEEYNQNDLRSALDFGIDGDVDTVKFSHYDDCDDHIKLLESANSGTSVLTKYPKGYFVNKTKEELLSALLSITKDGRSRWEVVVDHFYLNQLAPVIVVNKKLCDGAHRIVVCYLLNVPVKVAYFKADPLDEF